MSSYRAKLRDPRWQRLRPQALQAADFQCQDCGSTINTLNVHHNHYVYGREPWEYPIRELTVLCDDCHKAIGVKQKELALWLCRLGPGDLDEVIGYVKALASRVEDHEEKHEVRSFEEGLGFMLGAGTPFISSDVSDVLSELSGMVSVTALREHYLRVYPHLDPEV